MTSQKTLSPRPWQRISAPFATVAVAVLLGGTALAPLTMPSAQADADVPAMSQERLYQQFVPNADPADDLILDEIPLEKLPDPKPEPKPEKQSSGSESGESGGPSAPPRYEGGGSPAEWMSSAGISEDNWGYVDFIVRKESGWNPNATNASSGACGLVQALPCSKVPGSGYNPVDNLRWANGYAVGRYGSWEGAYAFWTSNHWW